MFELNGKYGAAKVFTDVCDEASVAQVVELLNQPYAEGSRIRLMPDIHAGAGCTIGTTMTVTDKICPNLVGVDIGCGMQVARIEEDNIEFGNLDAVIRRHIPSGKETRDESHTFNDRVDLAELRCAKHVDLDRARLSLGTLGGGNHFIEADRDNDGNLYLVIHSGSRHLGLEIAKYYQRRAVSGLKENRQKEQDIIDSLKAAGRQSEIEETLKKLKRQNPGIPEPLAYVSGQDLEDYLHDMGIAQEYAAWNRRAMMNEIIRRMNLTVAEEFTTIHNYIDLEHDTLRKGAVSAQKGEKLIIPINMRDGSLICVGKGNPDWNFSAPHGAGRLFSRGEAKRAFTVEEFEREMAGIYTTSVNQSTLDESPMAYKSIDDIVENIGPTADIISRIRPIYNFKASE